MLSFKEIQEIAHKGPFQPNWDSLSKHQVPTWFKELKFGIFIHWGLYSIPAFNNEWYSRNMYIQGSPEFEHHISTYGPHKNFGYKDFIPLFKATKFDAKEWVRLFKKAGAKYIFPVAEHHDGFQMYKSQLSKFNVFDMGPKRDVLMELKIASEKENLVFCASSHRAEHFFFFGHGNDFDSDVQSNKERDQFYWPAKVEQNHFDKFSKPYPDDEFLLDWLMRTVELVENYQPKIIYFDWWIQHEAFKPYLKLFAAYYYNRAQEWGFDASIAYKHDAMVYGSGIIDVEKGKFSVPPIQYWQGDTSVAHNSWCYTHNLEYKHPRDIIYDLIEVVSRNGNLLLNIGPTGDGSIPKQDQKILLEIGKWLELNGEAIFSTQPWKKCQEGPTKIKEGKFNEEINTYSSEDIRFTAKRDAIYAFIMQPNTSTIKIKSFREYGVFEGIIRNVEILGQEQEISWNINIEALIIENPIVGNEYPIVVKINID